MLLAATVAWPAWVGAQPSSTMSAQPGSTPGAPAGSADAIRVLMDQATYWRSQFQPQKADEALGRVLALDPQNADALASQAQGAIDAGAIDAARKALARLKAARPDDPRIAALDQAVRMGPPDMAGVDEARRLARAGKLNEATAAFRKAFHGDVPPPSLATEYYQMLAGADGGWDQARAGLAAIVKANPDDLRSQLAYAELLTYRDGTRDEGMLRLNRLTAYPPVAQQADASYRQALLWMPANTDNLVRYDTYLARHGEDAEIANRAMLAKNDPSVMRTAGFAALQAGHLADAEVDFTRALAADTADADALVGLALVRFRQHRDADGRTLIRRVIEIDPARKHQFENLLNPVAVSNTGAGRVAYGDNGAGAARSRRQYAEVADLTRRGDYVAAEAQLRRLMGGRPNVGNYVQLGSIQAAAGRADAATQSYRQALAIQPHNANALAGLGRLLVQAGRFTEAEALFAQAGSNAGAADIARMRAEAYRAQAGNATDLTQRTALLRDAVAAAPADPWIRLELARLLLSQGKPADGQAVMDAVTANAHASPQQLLAGVYYDNEAQNLPEAASLIARLPEKDRDGTLRQIQLRAGVAADLRDARAQGGVEAERRRLYALAAQPDPTGARVAAFAQELMRRGDKPGARELVRLSLASRPATPEQRIAYANVLLAADFPGDAKLVAGRLQGVRLNPLQATTLASVDDTIAASSADSLNGKGNASAAYNELRPRLAANPDSPELNMALARVYEAQQEPRRALQIDEALLQRNPSSLDVRRSTIDAAVAAGALGRAGDLAQETTRMFPDDPQAWIMAANVARARGNNGRALQDLETARTLRREQLRSNQSSAAERAGWARYAQYVPANTASDASPALLPIEAWEPVSRSYARYVPVAPTPRPAPQDSPIVAIRPIEARPVEARPIEAGDALAAPPILGQRAPTGRIQQAALQQPGVTAEYAPSDTTPFASGFGPTPTLDEPSGAPSALTRTQRRQLPSDPVLRDIDTSIAQVSAIVAPQVNGAVSLRGRSGGVGLEKLFEIAAPLEASYSPGGTGRLKVQVTPEYLYSGHVNTANLQRFGTYPLSAGLPQVDARNQQASGTGLDVGYAYGDVSADFGVTPIGFQERSFVGGVQYAPRLTDQLTLRVVGERRAVTDSVLSYAGTEDPRSGLHFGGVTRNRGHAQLEGGVGQTYFYAGAGLAYLLGNRVDSNAEVDAGAGFSTPVYADATRQVRLGLDLVYFGFDKNLAGFTVGQGGYFSPQQFFAALIPVNFRHQITPDLLYNVGGSVGYQTFRNRSTDVFPGNPELQGALAPAGLATTTAGSHASGIAGGVHGDIDYRVTDTLHVGGQAGLDRSGSFTEGTGLVYARYVFNRAQPID